MCMYIYEYVCTVYTYVFMYACYYWDVYVCMHAPIGQYTPLCMHMYFWLHVYICVCSELLMACSIVQQCFFLGLEERGCFNPHGCMNLSVNFRLAFLQKGGLPEIVHF